jgi:ppGpp synthetase/RelA/SpoT-type nucleotidyltranferase
METPAKSVVPKTDVESVLAEFEQRQPMLATFCAKTKALIEACLQDADIRYQSIQARVKTEKKLREKYLDPVKEYTKLGDITDLAGLRVITYYDDEIGRVVEVIEEQFEIDKKESVDRRNTDPDRFGYRAVNLICSHLDRRTSDVEYKRFAGVCCEIQVVSILGHAWSEIEHEWYDLRDAYPTDVKRRFSIIAALFELAGREFVDIRKLRADYGRAVALQVEAKFPDVPVDAVSLRTFIEQEPLVGEIDAAVASVLNMTLAGSITDAVLEYRSKAVSFAGLNRLQDLRIALGKFQKAIPLYAEICGREVLPGYPRAPVAERGISLYHLASLLSSSRGEESIIGLFKAIGGSVPTWNLSRQAIVAKEVIAKISAG